jgi:hypothetical protein
VRFTQATRQAWLAALAALGYQFPPLVVGAGAALPPGQHEMLDPLNIPRCIGS